MRTIQSLEELLYKKELQIIKLKNYILNQQKQLKKNKRIKKTKDEVDIIIRKAFY